jgi:dihydroorotate dehydrogenase electron transfer subunit
VLAYAPADVGQPLAWALFNAQAAGGKSGEGGFLAAPPIPDTWGPGTALELHGPLGRGFQLPGEVRRLGAAAFTPNAARLMPLVTQALERNIAVTLFSDSPLAGLPYALEVSPLAALPEALPWADFLALDLPLEKLEGLRLLLGAEEPLRCPAQALIYTPMPCGGAAECGACAVPARRGFKLACKDGPVFNLREIL